MTCDAYVVCLTCSLVHRMVHTTHNTPHPYQHGYGAQDIDDMTRALVATCQCQQQEAQHHASCNDEGLPHLNAQPSVGQAKACVSIAPHMVHCTQQMDGIRTLCVVDDDDAKGLCNCLL